MSQTLRAPAVNTAKILGIAMASRRGRNPEEAHG